VVVHGIADLFWHWPVLAYIVAHGSPPGRLVMTTMLLQAGVADTTKCRLGDVDRSDMMVRLLESHGVRVETRAEHKRMGSCTNRWTLSGLGWIEFSWKA
jgi:hypothetical protein